MAFTVAELRRALDRSELLLLYQAQVAMDSGRFAGIECAIRWQHPAQGRLHAVPFVNDVPPSGLAREFMRFIVGTASEQVARWRERSIEIPRFSINAWPMSIGDELLADSLRACDDAGIPPGLLEIETQPEAVYDREMCERLQAFRAAGIRVALDDFGDGDLRFAVLRDAPFDVVKLPVKFVNGPANAYDDSVITSGVAFARAIGAVTVAEGVETIATRDRVRDLGCDIGQGYLWSRQVEANAFPAVIRAISIDGTTLPTH